MLAHPEMLFYGEGSQFHLSRDVWREVTRLLQAPARATSPMPTATDVKWQGWPTMSTWAKRTFPGLFYFISFSRVSLISGWPQSHYIVEDGFELLIQEVNLLLSLGIIGMYHHTQFGWEDTLHCSHEFHPQNSGVCGDGGPCQQSQHLGGRDS